jgi:hypothetical protein
MTSSKTLTTSRTIDWQWVLAGFCLYVVFHLFPSYLFAVSWIASNPFSLALWAFMGLAPIGFFIGYRSSGVIILEPGLSALIYMVVLFFGIQQLQDEAFTLKAVAQSLGWMGAAYVVAIGSAWVGELLQARNKQNQENRT